MSNRRKVLYLVPSSGFGGAETFLRHVARFKKNETPVFCCLRRGPLVEELQNNGEKVHVFPSEFRLKNPWAHLRFFAWIREIVREERPALIHSTMAYAALLGAVAARIFGLPHVWFQHGPVRGWQTRWASKLPHRKVFVNSDYTRDAQLEFSKDPSRLSLLSLGVDDAFLENNDNVMKRAIEMRRDILQRVDGSKDRLLIAVLARLQEGKGIHLALEAFRRSALLQERAALVVWGEDLNTENAYHRDLESLGQGLPVIFAGPTRNGREAVLAADILLCASVWPETFGLAVVEGMALGKVVVAPDEGGPRELFEHGVSGLHFQSREVESLIAQLESVVRAEADSTSLGIEARQRVVEKYLASQAVESLEELHAEVVEAEK